jgi:hypothetical protein
MEIGCIEGEEEDVNVGGVWGIAAVTKVEDEAEGDWLVAGGKKPGKANFNIDTSIKAVKGVDINSGSDIKTMKGEVNINIGSGTNIKAVKGSNGGANIQAVKGLNLGNIDGVANIKAVKGLNVGANIQAVKGLNLGNFRKGVGVVKVEAVGGVKSSSGEVKPSDRRFVLGDFMRAPAGARLPQSSRAAPMEVRHICTVRRSPWVPVGTGEITIDSAAEESVCPRAWGEAYETRKPSRKLRFVNASGGEMGHYGEKTATFRTKGQESVMSLGFQVSDVQKPLASVWRIAEKGNIVQFGPSESDNFIMNVATGRKINMVRKAGSYVIEADYVAESPGFPRQAEK